jgi:putative spermidine/putrescine transport system permease protein
LQRRSKGIITAYPLIFPVFIFLAFFLYALWIFFILSFRDSIGIGQISSGFTFKQYLRFLGDRFYLEYLYRSLKLAAFGTLISLFLGYPTAYAMVKKGGRIRNLLTMLLFVQLFSIYVMRMYAIMLVLGNNGIINNILKGVHIIGTSLQLMYNELGVVIGLFIGSLPFMVFSISSSLDNIGKELEEAALSLGANRLRTFVNVTLPLSLPGIVSGILLVFSWNLSSYVTPALLGGGFSDMVANFIYDQSVNLLNYPLASSAAFVLLFITFMVIYIVNQVFEKMTKGVTKR